MKISAFYRGFLFLIQNVPCWGVHFPKRVGVIKSYVILYFYKIFTVRVSKKLFLSQSAKNVQFPSVGSDELIEAI